ncbi:prolyl oligopeptidase family serine peptidase [Inhella sp.]|uniref:S9 family peptidase n=1 Tax=Inhella sp. TaxID=1921806 RepID=UPI0035ADF225
MNPTLSRRRMLGGLSAGALTVAPGSLLAQEPPRPPSAPLRIDQFLVPPMLYGAQLSPDGQSLLTTRRVEGRRNLVVMDLATRKSFMLTRFKRVDVAAPMWLNNERILFNLSNRITDVGFVRPGLFSVNKDGSDLRRPQDWPDDAMPVAPSLTRFVARGAQADRNRIIAAKSESKGRHQALFRYDLLSGRMERLSLGAPGQVVDWAIDADDQPRAAITRTADFQWALWIRPLPEGEWTAMRRWGPEEPGVSLEAIDADEKLYLLHTPAGREEQVLATIDLRRAAWSEEPLLALQGVDLLPGAVRLDLRNRLRSVHYEADRPGVLHAEPKLDALQKAMEKEFPGAVVHLSASESMEQSVVWVSNDNDPGRLFLYREEGHRLEALGAARPWIRPQAMARTRFLRYAARDGLSIPAQLTLPPGAQPGQKHPLVVLHYGGPHVRAIRWGYDPMVQFLASRGYAVFMPAPRMSTGWGWKHHKLGWKQWGLAMQDDVTDGVMHLVKEGVADRDRLALMGASYGGYLTMMGLVKNPELWRCGVNWVGVTDPDFMYVNWTDFAGSDSAEYMLPRMLGDPKQDREQFAQTSPVRRAAEIQAPVLLAYGAADRRVPLINGERMRDALVAAGKAHEWVVYPDEGHGFRHPTHLRDFWLRIERFLGEHMAPRGA